MILDLLTIKIMLSKLTQSFHYRLIIFVIYQNTTLLIDQLRRSASRIGKDRHTEEQCLRSDDTKALICDTEKASRMFYEIDLGLDIRYSTQEGNRRSCDRLEICSIWSITSDQEIESQCITCMDQFIDFFKKCGETTNIDKIIFGFRYNSLIKIYRIYRTMYHIHMTIMQMIDLPDLIGSVDTIGVDLIIISTFTISTTKSRSHSFIKPTFPSVKTLHILIIECPDIMHRLVKVDRREDTFGTGDIFRHSKGADDDMHIMTMEMFTMTETANLTSKFATQYTHQPWIDHEEIAIIE